MLIHKRFDYFHRGVNEIWDEQKRYKKDLKVSDGLMFFYKHVIYFFVNKGQVHLAKDLEKGLNMAISDGSFKDVFLTNHKSFIENAKLDTRKLIIFDNPLTPKGMPALDTSWWAPQEVQEKIASAGY